MPVAILLAIILLGGFGVLRMIFVRHDPIGLSAFVLALVLTWLYGRLATSKHPYLNRAMGASQSKWPVDLARASRESFEFFPGRPQGYAGYTDYTAMNVDINDDLATRRPAEQYALLGFGNGFLNGICDRLVDDDAHDRAIFRVVDATKIDVEMIGWLGFLQQSGTDNAGPSTEVLHSVIRSVAREVQLAGPITKRFWDKVHNKLSESLDGSGTTTELLKEWTEIYETASAHGQRQARQAVVDSTI